MVTLQDFIHQMELGEGNRILKRYLRLVLCLLGVLVVVVGYDVRAFRNLSTEEAMDCAQLARNVAQGKGYTTQFIRPLSVYLVESQRRHQRALTNTPNSDLGLLKANHPDLANPPAYPLLLAGWMKVL